MYRFLLVLAATWLLGTIIATLQYLDVDGWSWYDTSYFVEPCNFVLIQALYHHSVGLAQSALASLLFAFTYVSALRADSLAWRKRGKSLSKTR